MANRNINRKTVVVAPEINESSVKAVSLRVPENLHAHAKICSEVCGIPINGLICIALAEFLSERGYPVHKSTFFKKS